MRMEVRKRFREIEDDWIDEVDVYSDKARRLLVEDDEMTPAESGFMEGYDDAI